MAVLMYLPHAGSLQFLVVRGKIDRVGSLSRIDPTAH